MAELKSLIVNGVTRLNNTGYAKQWYAEGVHHTAVDSNSYVVLAGGGYTSLSNLANSHSHPYLPLAGGTMTSTAYIGFGDDAAAFRMQVGDDTSNSPLRGITTPTVGGKWIGIFARPGKSVDEGGFLLSQEGAAIYNSFDSGFGFKVVDTDSSQGNWNADDSVVFSVLSDNRAYSKGGFYKKGSSDSYVLLGGGGHKALGDFSISGHTHAIKLGNTTIDVPAPGTTPTAVKAINAPFGINNTHPGSTPSDRMDNLDTSAFIIRRGTSDGESVKQWVDDYYYHILVTNDEQINVIDIGFNNTATNGTRHFFISDDGTFYPGNSDTGSFGKADCWWHDMYVVSSHAYGFYKTSSSNDYVLLGGGGHKLISDFALSGHEHDNRYYTESESDDRFVNVTGDTMTGDLHVYAHTYCGYGTGSSIIDYNVYSMYVGTNGTRTTTANSYYGGIAFTHMLKYSNGYNYVNSPQGWIGLRLVDTPGSERSSLVFATKPGTGTSDAGDDIPIERMCITPGGYVGIGTTSPSQKLHVSGGLLAITNNSNTVTIGSNNASWCHFENSADISFYFNKSVHVNGAIWQYGTNYGLASDGYFYAKGVYANIAGGSTYGGISLYSNSDPMTYGIAFRTTGTGTGEGGKLGRVQSDWATYFTMSDNAQRGWIFRSGSTNYASISARGEAYFSAVGNDTYIAYPNGGTCTGNDDGTKGAIQIALPTTVFKSSTMMKMTVEIYNYSTGTSCTYVVGGYNYSDGNWYNVFAYSIRQGTSGYGNLRVRFGNNDSRNIIWIGEAVTDESNNLTQTTWSYPQVYIKDVTLGHSNKDYNKWATGWNISFVTSFSTVKTYVDNPAVNYIAQNANYATSAGSATWSHYLHPHYDGGDKSNPQTYFNENIGVKVAMTRNTNLGGSTVWADTLWINGYTGGDVPNMCGLTFQRNGDPRFFIHSQSNRSTSYGTYYEVYTAFSDYEFNPVANIRYDARNNSFTKYAGSTGGWDTRVSSRKGYKECRLTYKISQTNAYIMVGITSDPTASVSYSTIDYCWYTQSGGGLCMYENGSSISSISGHTTYAVGDEFVIEYSNGYVRYYHNGVLCREVSRTYGSPLYLSSSIHTYGTFYEVHFEPIRGHSYDVNLMTKVSNWNTDTTSIFKSSESSTSNAPTTGFIYGTTLRFHREPTTYWTDLVVDLYNDRMFFRRKADGTYGSWRELIHSGNIGNQSVEYANNTGFAGTVAVNNSTSNSTYRMVWHSGNTLYSTASIYCNPSQGKLFVNELGIGTTTGIRWDNTFGEDDEYSFSENGLMIYQQENESSGIQFNGDTIYMWSPADGNCLEYYDEDDGQLMWYIDDENNFSGQAQKAYRLYYAKTINGVGFDGTQNITISPSLLISNNTIASKVGDQTSSYITVPYATNTDTVDGYHYDNLPYIEKLAWWATEDSHDVDSLNSGTTFAYANHNAPTTGTIVAFSSTSNSYPLQLQGSYSSENLYFRNKNGDNSTWNAWRTIIHSGNIGSQSVSYASSAGSATWASKLYNNTMITTSANLDAFHEAYTFKVGVWNGFNTSILNGNGLVLDIGYSSTTYGAQILIDDDPTYIIGLRQKSGSGWSAWKRIPMGDGTGASGTWGISITGNAATATQANKIYVYSAAANNAASGYTPTSFTANYRTMRAVKQIPTSPDANTIYFVIG